VRKDYSNDQLVQAGWLYGAGVASKKVEEKTGVRASSLRRYVTMGGLRREDYGAPTPQRARSAFKFEDFTFSQRAVIGKLCIKHNTPFDDIVIAVARAAFEVGFIFCDNLIDGEVTR
jgi:hypothetical protein